MSSKVAAYLAKKPFLRQFAGGVFTQVLLSLTSLALSTWIARETGKAEFGLYAVAINTVLIFLSIQNALVNSPLTVLLPEKTEEERKVLLSGLGLGQWLVILPLLVVAAVGTAGFGILRGNLTELRWVFMLLLIVPAAWMKEFLRVLGYIELRVGRIIRMDLVYVGTVLAGIFLLDMAGRTGSITALMAIGIAYAAAAAVGFRLARFTPVWNFAWIRQSFRETWKYSSWALIGIAASSVQMQGYLYIVSATHGLENTADISASRMLLVPFGLFLASSERIFLAKGSRIRGGTDGGSYGRFLLFFLVFFLGAWAAYVLLLELVREPLITFLFTGRYLNITPFLRLWALQFLLSSGRFLITYSLQVFKDFRTLALYGVASAVVVLISTFLLLDLLGPAGAILSLTLGELVLIGLALPRLIRHLRKRRIAA